MAFSFKNPVLTFPILGPTRTIGDVRSCAAFGAIADIKRASSRPNSAHPGSRISLSSADGRQKFAPQLLGARPTIGVEIPAPAAWPFVERIGGRGLPWPQGELHMQRLMCGGVYEGHEGAIGEAAGGYVL